MMPFLLPRSTALLILMASAAWGRDGEPRVRTVTLRDEPGQGAVRIYAAGQVATVLRFEHPCDPARTRMLGWEGHFEPLVCAGRSVLLMPLRRLAPEDRFLLLVTLTNGMEVPVTVSGLFDPEERWLDQQVNVVLDPTSRDALQLQLSESQESERALREEVRRRDREDTADHALAKLLLSGGLRQTTFRLVSKRRLRSEDTEMVVHLFSGPRKAAVLVCVTNHSPTKSWSLSEARLQTLSPLDEQRPPFLFGEARPFASRMNQEELAPGETGALAFVVDMAAFTTTEGLVNTLALELYGHEGRLDTHVLLDRRLARE